MKITIRFVLTAVLIFTSALVRAQGINFAKTEILTQQLAPDFYTLTGGNPNCVKQGALVIAREEVWQTLSQPFPPAVAAAIGSAASLADPGRLPILTYGQGAELKVRLNVEVIEVIGLPSAHTNGDTIVRFDKSDVIMIGDFYRNYGYPFVDSAQGGSFAGVIQAFDQVMALAGPDIELVPGHGAVIGRADLPPSRDMIVSVRKTVAMVRLAGRFSRPN